MIPIICASQKKYLPLTLLLSLALVSCASMKTLGAHYFIGSYGKQDPSPSRFSICYSHSCSLSADTQLSTEEWNAVRQTFDPGSSDAERERQSIAEAISLIETIVGKRTGTDADMAGSFAGMFRDNQMDCIDETVNTSTYLIMMKNDSLIRFHDLLGPVHRGYLLWGGWPHVAPVIADMLSGDEYVVDSWFLDNGQPPFIIPLEQWKNGWRPSSVSR